MTLYQPCAIFDADDTLWKTQEVFDAAITKFETLMYMQGFSPSMARETMMEINVELAKEKGAHPDNFATAMVETYTQFCQGLGTYYSRDVSRQLRAIAALPYTTPVELYDGVRETLETLREHLYTLILCTAGDTAIQLRKLEQSGLSDLFEHVHVVPQKTADVFDDIIMEHALVHFYTYMIGNSARSDINPATMAGLRCFWLDQGAWAYDSQPLIYPWRVYRINKITDVLNYLCAQQVPA